MLDVFPRMVILSNIFNNSENNNNVILNYKNHYTNVNTNKWSFVGSLGGYLPGVSAIIYPFINAGTTNCALNHGQPLLKSVVEPSGSSYFVCASCMPGTQCQVCPLGSQVRTYYLGGPYHDAAYTCKRCSNEVDGAVKFSYGRAGPGSILYTPSEPYDHCVKIAKHHGCAATPLHTTDGGCSVCQPGYESKLHNDGFYGCVACTGGSFGVGGSVPTAACFSIMNCVEAVSNAANQGCKTCSSGYRLGGSGGSFCESGCLSPSPVDQRPQYHYVVVMYGAYCNACGPGEYSNGDVGQNCQKILHHNGCDVAADATSCHKCLPGYRYQQIPDGCMPGFFIPGCDQMQGFVLCIDGCVEFFLF